jgi:hypothetical protein
MDGKIRNNPSNQRLYNPSMKIETITLNGDNKLTVSPDSMAELKEAWRLLGFTGERSAIVIVGGAGGMSEEDIAKVQIFFQKHLIPFAQKKNAVIIDGGTDSGVMGAIGRARYLTGADVPLIGVIARDVEGIMSMLEPRHTHFIFCPGSNWGDESEWIAAATSALAGSIPTIGIVINGGQITWNDVGLNIHYGRPVLIAEGSGRTADIIALTSTGHAFDSKAIVLIRTGKVHIANFFKEPEHFIEKMNSLMK